MTERTGLAPKKTALIGLAALAGIAAVAALVVSMGLFNVAADRPHSAPVAWFMQTVRNRSIAVRATGIVVPTDLGDVKRVKRGAAEYGEMCSSCHGSPGGDRSELSLGLYPSAPQLAKGIHRPITEQFWIVKHGLKMTAMPAWGVTHDDKILWDTIAFLQKLPGLTPDQYRELTRDAAEEHEKMGGHGSDHAMPGMNP